VKLKTTITNRIEIFYYDIRTYFLIYVQLTLKKKKLKPLMVCTFFDIMGGLAIQNGGRFLQKKKWWLASICCNFSVHIEREIYYS
jgi:hypothetical protein